jgi:hypothetical protein
MATEVMPFGKGLEMVALAENLAHSGSYANPFAVLNTGFTAANPPLYPFLLAAVVKVLGSAKLVAFVATLGNILANAFSAILLPHLSQVFYRDARPGIVAAILWILSSPLMPSWDVGLTVLTLLIFCTVSSATIGHSRIVLPALLSGLLAAALFLFNPSTVLIVVPWIGWLAFEHRQNLKRTTAYCCLALIVLAASGTAWAYRNHLRLGAYVIRTNLGMTLYASDNDCASPSLVASEANNCYQARHPNTSLEEAQLLSRLGEVKYDHLRVASTKEWIRDHPRAFLHLTLARFRDFWFPTPEGHPFKSAMIWIATLLSIPGFVWMVRGRNPAIVFALFVLSIYPLLYYIVVSTVRYRLPVLWLSLLPAGYFVVQVRERTRRR